MNANDSLASPLILLVEEDLQLRQSMEELLKLENYTSLSVANATEALSVIDSMSTLPGLIISDIVMKGMDEFQFLIAVRNKPAWKYIPFLFVSGQEAPGFVQDSKFGTVGYIPKPFNVLEFLDTVRRLTNRIDSG